MTSKPSLLGLVITACVAGFACTSTIEGSGQGGAAGSETPPPNGFNPSGSDASAAPPAAAPAEIEALFLPPTTETVTPDKIYGLWAHTDAPGVEDRLKVTDSTVTMARKCGADGRIAWVSVKVRASANQITILESKSATLAKPSAGSYQRSNCDSSVSLTVGEWKVCADYGSGCVEVTGTKLTGLPASLATGATEQDTWIKLSD